MGRAVAGRFARPLPAISQTAASIRQQYRSDLMGLKQSSDIILGETMGKDVVRGAIMSTGQVQRGVTPMGGFRSGVREVSASAGKLAGELEAPLPMPNLVRVYCPDHSLFHGPHCHKCNSRYGKHAQPPPAAYQ